MKKLLFVSLILLIFGNAAYGQKGITPAKKKLAAELTAATANIFPAEKFNQLFIRAQTEKFGETEKQIVDSISGKIDSSENLTTEEKDSIKAKLPDLSRKLMKISGGIMSKDFLIKNWADEAFKKHFAEGFTISELRQLNTYFRTKVGSNTAKLFNELIIGGIDEENTKPSDETISQMQEFLKKRVGQKFFNLLLEKIFKDIMQKTDAWAKFALKEIDRSLESGEMRSLLNDFISANLKT